MQCDDDDDDDEVGDNGGEANDDIELVDTAEYIFLSQG